MSETGLNKKFQFAQIQTDIKDEKIEGEAVGFFKDAMIRFRKNKASVAASIILGIIILFSIIGPSLSSYGWDEQNLDRALLPGRIPVIEKLGICDGHVVKNVQTQNIETTYKDALVKVIKTYEEKGVSMSKVELDAYKLTNNGDNYYWFGTDNLGRSQWTRLWRGTRVSLLIGLVSCVVNLMIGLVYGSIEGYYGGTVDMLMERFTDILGNMPTLVIIILFIMYFGTGFTAIALSMVMTGWIGTSRQIRMQFYRYKGQEYVLASRTMGATDKRLIFRHILPNAIGPIITSVSLAIPFAIFSESQLAYLGLGLQAPEPSIGVLLSEGQKVLLEYPHLTVYPAIVISVLMISFNLWGNGLRDAFNPTLRGTD